MGEKTLFVSIKLIDPDFRRINNAGELQKKTYMKLSKVLIYKLCMYGQQTLSF